MSKAELLRDIEAIISGTEKNDSYPSLIEEKNEIAHFLLFTNTGTVQITTK